jgi:hypothetical protein
VVVMGSKFTGFSMMFITENLIPMKMFIDDVYTCNAGEGPILFSLRVQ